MYVCMYVCMYVTYIYIITWNMCLESRDPRLCEESARDIGNMSASNDLHSASSCRSCPGVSKTYSLYLQRFCLLLSQDRSCQEGSESESKGKGKGQSQCLMDVSQHAWQSGRLRNGQACQCLLVSFFQGIAFHMSHCLNGMLLLAIQPGGKNQ